MALGPLHACRSGSAEARPPPTELTFPTGGGAFRGPELLPVVISAASWGLWRWRHQTAGPVGGESIWMADGEGLRRLRGEHLRCPALQVLLLLGPRRLLALLRTPPLREQLALEGLPWRGQCTHRREFSLDGESLNRKLLPH